MTKNTRYLGLDVHGETITAAVAAGRKPAESLGQFPNSPESVRKFIEKLGDRRELKVCYEAGPTGYALFWQLKKLGVECEVIAPSLIPKKPGERIKTDRRDALKLAECYRGDCSRRCGFPTPRMKRCATWCALEPQPNKTRAARSTGW